MRCLILLLMFGSAFAQPIQGPLTVLDSSVFLSPQIAATDDDFCRLFWADEQSRLMTAVFDWTTESLIEEPTLVYQSLSLQPAPKETFCRTIDEWYLLVEETEEFSTPISRRLLLIKSFEEIVTVDTLLENNEDIAFGIPFNEFKVIDLFARPGGGLVIPYSFRTTEVGSDYYFAHDRPAALFIDESFELERDVIAPEDDGWFNIDYEDIRVALASPDCLVFVRSIQYDSTDFLSISASGNATVPTVIDCPRQWLGALAYDSADELILFSTSAIQRIVPSQGCQFISDEPFPRWTPYDSKSGLGATALDGSSAGNYVTLYRVNMDGSVPAPRAGVQVLADPNLRRTLQDVIIADSTVYVLWTFGAHYSPTAIGMFRVGWSETISEVDVDLPAISHDLSLSSYPNPFNSTVTIKYDLPQAGDVSLSVFDLQGRFVETLHNGFTPSGSHTLSWSPTKLASGVYFARLNADYVFVTSKLLYLK